MSRRFIGAFGMLLAGLVWAAAPAAANDKWEFGSLFNDDSFSGKSVFGIGVAQTHDLEGTAAVPDQDWIDVPEVLGHSFEVRVSGGAMQFNTAGFGCANCADLHRVNAGGTVQTSATGSGASGQALLRWIDVGGGTNYKVRVTGSDNVNFTTNEEYDIQLFDTTYFIPRWSNAGTQVTVVVIRNNTSTAVTGDIYFYDAAGALLHTEALNVAPRGSQVVATASIPALAGSSGSIAVAHLGGFGALSGKAVSIEASTGFTFDTMMVPFGQ